MRRQRTSRRLLQWVAVLAVASAVGVASGTGASATINDAGDFVPTPRTFGWNDEDQWAIRANENPEGAAVDRSLVASTDEASLDAVEARAGLADMTAARSDLQDFSDLKFTVSQTTDLRDQVIDLSWTGGTQSFESPSNFMQVMQCWSASVDTPPTREQCAFGGTESPGQATQTAIRSRNISLDPSYTQPRSPSNIKVLDPRERGIFASAGELVPVRGDERLQISVAGGTAPTWRDDEPVSLNNLYLQCPEESATYRLEITHLASDQTWPVILVDEVGARLNSPASPSASIPAFSPTSRLFTDGSTDLISLAETREANNLDDWLAGEYRVTMVCDRPAASDNRTWTWQAAFNADLSTGTAVWRRGNNGLDSANVTIPFDPVGDSVDRAPTGSFGQSFAPLALFRTKLYEHFAYFNSLDRNELAFARTRAGGTGSYSFVTRSSNTASHLGCGTPTAACWMVVVPRGQAEVDAVVGANGLRTSPLSQSNWDRRVTIPLQFLPLDLGCRVSGDLAQIDTVPVAESAIGSYQAGTCNSNPVRVTPLVDSQARGRAARGGSLSATVRPPTETPTRVTTPLALTSLVVAYRIDRQDGFVAGRPSPSNGVPITRLRLTPLLMAKLLTQSYVDTAAPNLLAERDENGSLIRNPDISYGKRYPNTPLPGTTFSRDVSVTVLYRDLARTAPRAEDFLWSGNAPGLFYDPEFLLLNPELAPSAGPQGGTGLLNRPGSPLVSAVETDAYGLLWDWVMGDARAAAFMRGQDVEGVDTSELSDGERSLLAPYLPFNNMRVNPYYAGQISPEISRFPRLDPTFSLGTEYLAAEYAGFPLTSPLDSSPLLESDARVAQSIADGRSARRVRDPNHDLRKTDVQYWPTVTEAAKEPGNVVQVGVTTGAYARQYGLRAAELQNSDGNFVGPTSRSLLSARSQMSVSGAGILTARPEAVGNDGYPLTIPIHASTDTALNSPALNGDIAEFLRFATTDGQVPGLAFGQLPPGYVPLPEADLLSARSAADRIAAASVAASPASAAATQPAATTAPRATAPAVAASPTGRSPAPSGALAPAAGAPADEADEATPDPTPGIDVSAGTRRAATGSPANPLVWIIPVVLGLGLAAAGGGAALTAVGRRAGA